MLKMSTISKIYRTDLIETHALRELDLHVEEGEFVSVTGPSGSGKTTFLNIAGLLESPTSGLYELDGQDVSQLNDNQRSRIRNQKVGFIFQSFHLVPYLTVIENVMLPLAIVKAGKKKKRMMAEVALSQVGLSDKAQRLPGQISGGEKERVAIARSIVNEPPVLLADEPTGNLDTQTTREIMELLSQLNKEGMTIIMVTHSPDCAEYAQRVIRVSDGRLLYDN